MLRKSGIVLYRCRAGLSQSRARLEALLRGPTQWRVQNVLRASSHNHKNHKLCEGARPEKGNTQLTVSGAIRPRLLLPCRLPMPAPRTSP